MIVMLIDINGRNQELAFKFGTMRKAEQALGQPLPAVLSDKLGFDAISAIFWASVGGSKTRDETDDMIDQAGMAAVMAVVSEGLAEYFGQPTGDAPGDAPGE